MLVVGIEFVLLNISCFYFPLENRLIVPADRNQKFIVIAKTHIRDMAGVANVAVKTAAVKVREFEEFYFSEIVSRC